MDPTVPNPEPEREPQPLADVASWAAELEQRLRDSASKHLAGLDAATADAATLAGLLAPEPVHYDPGTLERLTLCNLNTGELAPSHVATNPALATCPECTAALVDSQLPPAPRPAEIHSDPDGFADLAPPMGPTPPPAGHRTVGLEVLTSELRIDAAADHPDAVVGVVFRADGEVVAVPEVDAEFRRSYITPPDMLAVLLRQARYHVDGTEGAELLMPGPDVLAALAGKPVGRYTATVETRWGLVKAGYLVLLETMVDDQQDFVWLLVEDRTECSRPDCLVAEGTSWACAVTTIRGRGIQHLSAFNPVAVRIPADTAVEL